MKAEKYTNWEEYNKDESNYTRDSETLHRVKEIRIFEDNPDADLKVTRFAVIHELWDGKKMRVEYCFFDKEEQ